MGGLCEQKKRRSHKYHPRLVMKECVAAAVHNQAQTHILTLTLKLKHTHTHAHTHTHTRTHARTHAHTHARTRTHTHAHTHTHTHAHTRAHVHARTHACTRGRTRTHTHTHLHARMHAHTGLGTHAHTHISTLSSVLVQHFGQGTCCSTGLPVSTCVCHRTTGIALNFGPKYRQSPTEPNFRINFLPGSIPHGTLHAFQIRCRNSFGKGEFWQI